MINPKFRTPKNRVKYIGDNSESDIKDIFGPKFWRTKRNSLSTVVDDVSNQDYNIEDIIDNQQRYNYANFRLKQVLGLHELNDSFQSQSLLNSLFFSQWYRFFGLFITFLQCSLLLLEPVSVWWTPDGTHTTVKNSVIQYSIIELCCIIFHCITLFVKIYAKTSLKDVHWILWLMVMITTFSVISVLISCFWINYVRFHRAFRPFFFTLYWKYGLWCLEIIVMTLIAIIKPFCVALLSITIFSGVVYSMFCEKALLSHRKLRDLAGEIPQFSSFGRTWLEMFILQTTENFPDVMVKIYATNSMHCWVFIIYLIVQFLLITNLFLCIVCELNKKIIEAKLNHKDKEYNELLNETWFMLSMDNDDRDTTLSNDLMLKLWTFSDRIDKTKYLMLLSEGHDYGKGVLSVIKKEIIWYALSRQDSNTNIRYIHKAEFVRYISWYLGARIQLTKSENNNKIKDCCRRIVNYRLKIISGFEPYLFALIFDIISMAQCGLTFWSLFVNKSESQCMRFLVIIDYIWIFEILIRIIGTPWRKYINSRHVLNGIITVIVILINIGSQSCYERMDDSIELLRLFVVALYIIKHVYAMTLYPILKALMYGLKSSYGILVQMIFVMYGFAAIGMDLFGDLFDHLDINDSKKAKTIHNHHYSYGEILVKDNDYRHFNFDTVGNAMCQSFIGLIANNWSVFMSGYANIIDVAFESKNDYVALISYVYFCVLMVIIPSILLQILTAILLDTYDRYMNYHKRQIEQDQDEDVQEFESDYTVENKKMKIYKFIKNQLQDAADALHPDVYKIDCFEIPNYCYSIVDN